MLGIKLITRREMVLWLGTIQDLKEQIIQLRGERDHERARAEAAINLVLAKKTGAVLNPVDQAMEKREADMQDALMDIFGENESELAAAKQMIEDIQAK